MLGVYVRVCIHDFALDISVESNVCVCKRSSVCLYVFVCVSTILLSIVSVERSNVCVCACVKERERECV